MEQHFKTVIGNMRGTHSVYEDNPRARLMGHSWCGNPFADTITKMIYNNPQRVAWVGNHSEKINTELHKIAWLEKTSQTVEQDPLYIKGMYLVNHTKKQFLNCDEYLNRTRDLDSANIHPLPLLTAVTDGTKYTGDYIGDVGREWIGAWAYDEIEVCEIKKNVPHGYIPIMPTFLDPYAEPYNILDIVWDIDDDDVLEEAHHLDDETFKNIFGVDKNAHDADSIVIKTLKTTDQAASIIMNLPVCVTAPNGVIKQMAINDDAVTDWLSDEYNFAVKSYVTSI